LKEMLASLIVSSFIRNKGKKLNTKTDIV